MKKPLISHAIVLALLTPIAQADTFNVNVYGRIRAGIESVNGAGAATYVDANGKTQNGKNSTSQVRIVDNASVLGFKGNEDLGDGLILQWQAEGQLEADGDADGRLNSRNTFIALKHEQAGTLLAGQYDTPYKLASARLRSSLLSDTTAELAAVLNKGLGQNFYTRQKSTLQYHSPTWAGFDFKLAYAPDESKTESKNGQRISLAANYDNGTFFASLGHENRADASGTDTAKASLLVLGYSFDKNSHIAVGGEQLGLGDKDQTNLYVAATYRINDNWSFSAHLGKAEESGDDTKDSALQLGLAAGYDLSKRTNITAYYGQIKNDQEAKYNFNDNAIDALQKGNDPRVLGLGLNIKF